MKFTFYEWLTIARVPPKISASPSPAKLKGRSPAARPPKAERVDPAADAFMYE